MFRFFVAGRMMSTRSCVWGFLAAAGLTVVASAKEPQLIGSPVRVTPIRIAPIQMVDGDVIQREWIPYVEPVSGCFGAEHYDLFDPDDAGFPEDEDRCGLPSGHSRWYLGQDYCNAAAANDIVGASPGAQSLFTNFAWYWYCDGGWGSEQCVIDVFTGENWDACNAFDGYFDGIRYDFGWLGCNPGDYYYTNVNLTGSGLFHQMPADGDGFYQVMYRTDDGFSLATCAQPMLWGTGANRPGGPQDAYQWDDDAPRDGYYDGNECYDYAFGVCPDPLGAMHSFGDGSNNCGYDCPSWWCNGTEVLKAGVRQSGDACKVKARLRNATPGYEYGILFPSGQCVQRRANDRGRVYAKECPSQSGNVLVPDCGLSQYVECPVQGTNCANPPPPPPPGDCGEVSRPINCDYAWALIGRPVGMVFVDGEYNCVGILGGCGSGFLINDRCFLTAAHVVTKRDGTPVDNAKVQIWFDYEDKSEPFEWHINGCQRDPAEGCGPIESWTISGITIVSPCGELDCAILHVEARDGHFPGEDHGWVVIRAEDAQDGEEVNILHHPGGECKEHCSGERIRVLGVDENDRCNNGRESPLFSVSTKGKVESGSSGAPVFDEGGYVVGMLLKTVVGHDIACAVKISSIREAVEDAGCRFTE